MDKIKEHEKIFARRNISRKYTHTHTQINKIKRTNRNKEYTAFLPPPLPVLILMEERCVH